MLNYLQNKLNAKDKDLPFSGFMPVLVLAHIRVCRKFSFALVEILTVACGSSSTFISLRMFLFV